MISDIRILSFGYLSVDIQTLLRTEPRLRNAVDPIFNDKVGLIIFGQQRDLAGDVVVGMTVGINHAIHFDRIG